MKVLDLFSGIGGFSHGLDKVGFKTVAFCEMDEYCKLVLQKHWKGVKIYNDVKELKGKEIIKEHGTIDIVVGGFPCQPFSVAGARKGTDDNRHLWPEMFRIIKELKPRWVIGENVRGIVSIQNGMVFENVCTDLEGEGYEEGEMKSAERAHKREGYDCITPDALRESSSKERTNESKQEDANQYQRSSSTSTDNADTNTRLSNGSIEKVQSGGQTLVTSSQRTDVAYTYSQRQQEQCRSQSVQKEGNKSQRGSSQARHTGWESEPDVGRVAHGLSGRVHRLKALGNSIVPKIAEEIGRAIMTAEAEDNKYQSGGAYKAMLKLFRTIL